MLLFLTYSSVELTEIYHNKWENSFAKNESVSSGNTGMIDCITVSIWSLFSQVAVVFNLFITYGDTFLPNPHVYDELYYELIRMHIVFENLYSLGNHMCVLT